MVRRKNATSCPDRCARCGSDLVVTIGAGRALRFQGVVVALPADFRLVRCHGCDKSMLTPVQTEELRASVERDEIGFGRDGVPVLRGT